MIKSVTVTSYTGESLKMTLKQPEKSGIIIKDITGLGAADADINTTDLATGDGALFNSSRVQSRNIVMTLQFMNKPNIEYIRHVIYRYFHIKQPLTLHFKTDYRDIYIDGYVESNEIEVFSENETAQISVICPNPFFYKPVETSEQFYSIEPLFEFRDGEFYKEEDFESPNYRKIIMGEDATGESHIVTYMGEFETGVLLTAEIDGPVTGLKIWSVEDGQEISINDTKLQTLTGSQLKMGDLIVINTKPGQKAIRLERDGKTYNIINCINRNAGWFKLNQGDNEFIYKAATGRQNVKWYMNYNELFEGL